MPPRLPDGRTLALDRPLIMGILNVTPDSFSDGGQFSLRERAIAHALDMVDQGADLIDVGGESTRPGSQPVEPAEQIRRVVEVIRGLREALDRAGRPAVISIDTSLAAVAAAALEAGASIINDVHAGGDPRNGSPRAMFELAAARGAPLVLMHMQGSPATMQRNPTYADVVSEVRAFLLERTQAAMNAGLPREQILLDPGIGFGKTREHNLSLLANLARIVDTEFPVLLGASRKRFMGSLCPPGKDGQPLAPAELVGATCATTALGVAAGVRIFRVHDVQANRQAADVAWALARANGA
ncbi:MAG: dihydropteroate synthase [Planctomycetota bacterium]|nr:dihydropteroate synthase [Planctomycetota bacterium]